MGTGKTYSTKYLLDSNNSSGVAGQVLSTTSTGIDWVDANTVPGAGLWLENGNDIYNSNSGNVGIGTTSPSKKLEVAGSYKLGTNAYIQYDASYPYTISTLNTAAVGNLIFTAGAGSSGYESGITLQGSNTASDDGITFTAGSSAAMVIQVNGNVGIGTTSPLALLSVGSGSLADTNVAVQISTSGGTSQKWFGVNKNGSYGLLMGYLEGGSIGDGGAGAYIRNITEDPLYFMVSNSDLAMTILANKNVGIGTTSPDAKLTVSNGGAAGLEFFPEYTTNNNLINSYNRSSTAYLTIETRASEHYWDIGTTNKMSLNSSGNLNVNGEIQGDSFSGPGQGLDNLLPLGVYSTTPGTAGVLIKTNIASNNYGFIFGTINLEQFNFTSVQRIQLSATVASNGTVVTKAATSDIAITMKLFHVGGYWHIHLPTASTYVTASAYIYTGAGYQGQAKGFNEVNTITVNPVPSGATSSVDIVADVYVTTGSAGGSGPFLPLSAGSSYPLTGTLYLGNVGSDQKIQFQRTGGNVYSIEHDSAQLYFYNRTTTESPLVIQNDGDVLMNAGNVGIGTTTPQSTLHVYGDIRRELDGTSTIGFGSGSTSAWYSGIKTVDFGAQNVGLTLFTTTNAGTTNVDALTIDEDGNVGIGTTSPASKLQVSGSGNESVEIKVSGGTTAGNTGSISLSRTDGGGSIIQGAAFLSGGVPIGGIAGGVVGSSNTSAPAFAIQTPNSTNGHIVFNPKGTEKMRITSGGNVGIGVTNPGIKLQLISADEQLTNFSSSVADQLAYSQINANSSTSGTITAAAALELVGKANGSGHGRHAWIGAEGTSNTTLLTKLKFKVRGQTANGYDWAGASEAPTIMTLEGDGNVGIGTTSPTNKLHIQGSQATVYSSTDTGGQASAGTTINNTNTSGNTNNFSQLLFTVGTNNNSVSRIVAIRSGSDASDLAFVGKSTAGVAEYMRIKSGGNVGIGINNPSALLEVRKGSISGQIAKFSAINPHVVIESSTAGNAVLHLKPNATSSKSGQFKVTAGNGYNFRWSNDASGTAETAYMDLDTSTTGGGDLTVKGDVIAYGSPSDKKYKENIKPIESALDKAMQLQGVTFDWKDSESILEIKEDIGFIAQDVQEVLPELVRDNGKGNLSLRYQGITPILLEAIKELKAEIEELKLNNCNCNK